MAALSILPECGVRRGESFAELRGSVKDREQPLLSRRHCVHIDRLAPPQMMQVATNPAVHRVPHEGEVATTLATVTQVDAVMKPYDGLPVCPHFLPIRIEVHADAGATILSNVDEDVFAAWHLLDARPRFLGSWGKHRPRIARPERTNFRTYRRLFQRCRSHRRRLCRRCGPLAQLHQVFRGNQAHLEHAAHDGVIVRQQCLQVRSRQAGQLRQVVRGGGMLLPLNVWQGIGEILRKSDRAQHIFEFAEHVAS